MPPIADRPARRHVKAVVEPAPPMLELRPTVAEPPAPVVDRAALEIQASAPSSPGGRILTAVVLPFVAGYYLVRASLRMVIQGFGLFSRKLGDLALALADGVAFVARRAIALVRLAFD